MKFTFHLPFTDQMALQSSKFKCKFVCVDPRIGYTRKVMPKIKCARVRLNGILASLLLYSCVSCDVRVVSCAADVCWCDTFRITEQNIPFTSLVVSSAQFSFVLCTRKSIWWWLRCRSPGCIAFYE